jgi:hypothetical protein
MNTAEQYRALVKKLEQIQEAPEIPVDPTSAPAFDPGAGGNSYDTPPATTPATTEIPTIEAPTFKQAYAQAVKQKLKKFKWCGTFVVKDAPKPNPQVKPATGTAINDRNANGSYVGQNGLDSQTPSFQPGA